MSKAPETLIIGTRGSKLARIQTDIIASLLQRRVPSIRIDVRIVQTEGDRLVDRPISEVGDKGMFVRAIERAVLDGDVDLAVHSLKDVPSDVETPGLSLLAFSARSDARDVLVSRQGGSLADLPMGARIGTGSLRRKVQVRECRGDLQIVDIRGNVDTRLRKLDDGEYDGVILAAAGLSRLGLEACVTEYLPVERFTPDAGQGIIAIQGRTGDERVGRIARAIDDRTGRLAALAERAAVRALGADCRSPVGVYASISEDVIRIIGMAAVDGEGVVHRGEIEGGVREAEVIGRRLGEDLWRAVSGDGGRES